MPVITSTNYWSTVFSELQEEIERNGHAKYLYIAKRYDEAIRLIEDRIRAWYGRHALDGKIPLRQAYKKLPPNQLEQFKELIDFYLRNWNDELGYEIDTYGQKVSKKDSDVREIRTLDEEDASESDVSEEQINDAESWITYLQDCKNRDDITYYEALCVPILNEVEKVSHDTAETLLALLVLSGWAVHHDIAKNLKIQGLAQEQLKKELLKSWAKDNLNLYDRFNANKAKLSASVKTALVKGFKNEMSVDEVVAEVSKVMGIGAGAAKRLVVTENSFFNTQATYLALKEAGYTHYRYICRLLPTSCDICIALHNTVFPIEMYEVGVTSPPQHPHCLCYIVGEDN